MKFPAAFRAQPKPLVYAEAIVLMLAIGWFDYATEWEFSLFVLYAVPIFLVVWLGDRRVGILLAVACGLVWFVANAETQPYRTSRGYLWATANRLVYFVFVAIGGAAMRMQREESRARLEAMARARELEQEIVRVSEHEQMRIGQDLHDGLCQNLAAIDCAVACLKADLDERSLPEAATAGVIQKMLNDSVVEARSLARGIFPVQMDAAGLPAALEDLVSTTNLLRHATATCEVRGDIQIEDPQVAMHLYRIAQEALSNALRHAEARRISLRLAEQDGMGLTMAIEDDGRGFTPAAAAGMGMGLRTIRYRAQLIGATLEIDSQPGRGTAVRCSLALSSKPPATQLV